MRVLHLAAGNLYGGVEAMLVTLAREASACPTMQPEFAVCYRGRLSESLQAAGAEWHELGPARLSRPWTLWRSRRRLKHLLAKRRYDAVIAHGCWPHVVFGGVCARSTALVFWGHDAGLGAHWLDRRAKRLEPRLAIVNSNHTALGVGRLFSRTAREVLYCPVAAPRPIPGKEARASLRRELNTADDAIVILQVSRMERWKGHELLLRALVELRGLQNWTLWIAGGAQRPNEERYLEELRSTVQREGLADRVRFLGERTDVPSLMNAADIFCQPNIQPEPFGIVFIEALYSGLPVLASASGGALEIVNERCGLLVDCNPVAVAAGLRRLLDDGALRASLGAAGPGRAAELCGVNVQIPKLERVLARAIV